MSKDKYTRERIDEIFLGGTVKEKAELFARDRMGYFPFGISFILKYGEPEKLLNTIKSYEMWEWNDYLSYILRIENGFKDIVRVYLKLGLLEEELNKDLAYLVEFDRLERVINDLILNESVKEEDVLDNICSKRFDIVSPVYDSEKGLSLSLYGRTRTGERSLYEQCQREQDFIQDEFKFLTCYQEAMRRRIKEGPFPDIPEYETLLSKTMRYFGPSGNNASRFGATGYMEKTPSLNSMREDFMTSPVDLAQEEDEIMKIYKSI